MRSFVRRSIIASGLALGLLLAAGAPASAQLLPTTFTYQGVLTDAGQPFSGSVNLSLALFDQPEGGELIGTPVQRVGVPVNNGVFSVEADFGASPASRGARWVEIKVQLPGQQAVVLSPRQPLTAAPLALGLPGVTVTPEGNVGIGLEMPLTRLAVDGQVSAAGVRFADGTVQTTAFVPGATTQAPVTYPAGTSFQVMLGQTAAMLEAPVEFGVEITEFRLPPPNESIVLIPGRIVLWTARLSRPVPNDGQWLTLWRNTKTTGAAANYRELRFTMQQPGPSTVQLRAAEVFVTGYEVVEDERGAREVITVSPSRRSVPTLTFTGSPPGGALTQRSRLAMSVPGQAIAMTDALTTRQIVETVEPSQGASLVLGRLNRQTTRLRAPFGADPFFGTTWTAVAGGATQRITLNVGHSASSTVPLTGSLVHTLRLVPTPAGGWYQEWEVASPPAP